MHYMYILECEDGSLYSGITDNLKRRFQRHSIRQGGRYTSYNPPIRIIYFGRFKSKSEAVKREKQIKKWTRAKKLALAEQSFELLKRL